MSRIFFSHSSQDNAEAIALRDWLEREGWKYEIFLDLDPTRGISAGAKWERALNQAASRCEAVLFLVSKAWIASDWCRKELSLAHRLNKRLFGVLIEELPLKDIPGYLSGEWQLVRLASGRDHIVLDAVVPITHEEVHVTFSREGLQRLKHGLEMAGLDPKYFPWPPAGDPDRPLYRGLRSLEAEDAGIFFGRDGPVVDALDRLRALREAVAPRLIVILGASGAGKSSFLRAGLLPRLKRDDRVFFPLPIIRPDKQVLSGETGLLRALEGAFQVVKLPIKRADLRTAIAGGVGALRPVLKALVEKATIPGVDQESKPPALVIAVDQAEELFLAEGQEEAQGFLALMHDLLAEDAPAVIAVCAIRSDSYEQLQEAKSLESVRKIPFDLSPMPKGSYVEVIKGPALRMNASSRPLKIEDTLVDALLVDIEEGGAKDALPLLAFTLERLYVEHGGDGHLTLSAYRRLNGIKGSIEAAIEHAFKEADRDAAIPKDRQSRLTLLRRGLIPWLAGIDPNTGTPRRRVARRAEIPEDSRPLIEHLVRQRLLVADVSKTTGEQTIEVAHEALLRQWGDLQSWLIQDGALLSMLEGVRHSSRDWAKNDRNAAWLIHAGGRLEVADRLAKRIDLAANLEQTDRDYLDACRAYQKQMARRRVQIRVLSGVIFSGVILLFAFFAYEGWLNQSYLKVRMSTLQDLLWPKLLTASRERALKPGQSFQECSVCPEMVVVPAGQFIMGSPPDEDGREDNEEPQHKVTIGRDFSVAKFELTFEQWDACVELGGCKVMPSDQGLGRVGRPVAGISWNDAQDYVTWLSKLTGKPYRLLSEAEWEYSARAGSHTAYSWGNDIGIGNANCSNCGSKFDRQVAPVGSFPANAFGLYDMHGNVWEWVQDCYQNKYDNSPEDGSAWMSTDCDRKVVRGGSWDSVATFLRSAYRDQYSGSQRNTNLGLRVARSLQQ